jgi:Tol biopolymer transport system component/DNA-binding winged helix-turn-helix (wHTH) protein
MDGDFRIGDFLVQPQLNCIAGPDGEEHIEPKVMEVLMYLARHSGEVLPKNRIIQAVWVDTFVTDDVLIRAITALRKAFGDDPSKPKIIQTVPRKGYRLMVSVNQVDISTEQRKNLRVPMLVGMGIVVLVTAGFTIYSLWNGESTFPDNEPPLVAVPLTSYPGEEYCPSFSPEGDRVVFMWNGENRDNWDVYIQQIGVGGPVPLTRDPAEEGYPSWSPDGRSIAFLRKLTADKYAVLLIPPLGGFERKLAEIRLSVYTNPFNSLCWSPDSQWLAVRSRSDSEERPSIFLLSVGSGDMIPLTSGEGYGDFSPAFSPDGRYLVFSRQFTMGHSPLYLLELDSNFEPIGEPRQLFDLNGRSTSPVWVEGGREIIFLLGTSFSTGVIYRASVSEPPMIRPLGVGGSAVFTPAVSQRERRLVFSEIMQDRNIYRIALGDQDRIVNGETSREVSFIESTRDDRDPQYSPDGHRIAFSSERTGNFEIWVCDSDGKQPRRLTSFNGPAAAAPCWSPDGRMICFVCRPEGHADVYIIRSQGGTPTRLTRNTARDRWPSWSRDGNWIYFNSNRSGQEEVWKISPNGGEAFQVTQNGGTYAVESPDGNFLYYGKEGRPASIWRRSLQGGEENQVVGGLSIGFGFAVTQEGIYSTATGRTGSLFINFFEFASRDQRLVAVDTAGRPSVSPDGRWILYTKGEEPKSDLMLVENFR